MAGMDRMMITEVVREVLRDEHADVIRESVRAVAQELVEAGLGVDRRAAWRAHAGWSDASHGYRSRRWETGADEVELQIPKIRQGS